MTTSLQGKIALLTGASSGIGLATSQALIAEGVHVVAVARSLDRLTRLAESAPGSVTVIAADVSD
ncbi:MAG: SDR family NAD(P)-dependent oxidoreductase, partial [Microcella pacifica]